MCCQIASWVLYGEVCVCVCVDIMEYSGSPRVLYTTDQENLLISWLKPIEISVYKDINAEEVGHISRLSHPANRWILKLVARVY